MSRRWPTVVLATLLIAAPAHPCGGPGAAVVNRPLVSETVYLNRVVYEDEYDATLREGFRFLDPMKRAMPDSVADIYDWAYVNGGGFFEATADDTVRRRLERELLQPVYDRLSEGSYAAAVAEARRMVAAVLDRPAGLAVAHGDALRTAVEVVDIVPRLTAADRAVATQYVAGDSAARDALGRSGALPPVLREALGIRSLGRNAMAAYADAHPDSPRVPSLRFVALQEAMRTGIPDGYAHEIRDSVPPGRWADLEHLHDTWLRRYASHPMADYVRLSKVRLFYFMDDGGRAWNELLALYPRHRQRVLGEMRYLVYRGMRPPSLDDPRIDWPLRAALLIDSPLSIDNWNSYWRATEAHEGEPWVLPMQERLLWRAARLADSTRSLPAAFPNRAMAPSAVWASLRLIALLDAGRIGDAFAQADSTTDSTVDVQAIRARLHLMRGEWGRAVSALGENDASASYLIRVVAPRAIVDSLAKTRSAFATEARLTNSARLASAGDWRAAARAAAGMGAEGEQRWRRTAVLASDTSRAGTLAFARWMREQRGQLFFGEDTEWLRALNWRLSSLDTAGVWATDGRPDFDTRLPWTAAYERDRIMTHLRSTTELYYALTAYAKWLDGASSSTPGLAAVVREADQVYNRLANWDSNNSLRWGRMVEASAEARSIRRAGALLRRR